MIGKLLREIEKELVRSIGNALHAQPGIKYSPRNFSRLSSRPGAKSRNKFRVRTSVSRSGSRAPRRERIGMRGVQRNGNAGRAVLDFNSKLFESGARESHEILFGALRRECHFHPDSGKREISRADSKRIPLPLLRAFPSYPQ